MKRVLFTGHGGFVGHHCLEYWLEHTDWEFVCIDSFRHMGTCRRVVEVGGDNPRVKTFRHDLTAPIDPQLDRLMRKAVIDPLTGITHYTGPIDYIINMASDSAVERSVSDPTACMRNNYELMINMLEYGRLHRDLEAFIHISTDEVFGEAPANGGHKEWATTMPSNPYAASKAAQEALAIAYWRTYNMPIILTNCMNLIGERQNPEKFLPKIIQKIALGQEMPIYCDSEEKIGSRVYLHAKNLADAIMFIIDKGTTRYADRLNGPPEDIKPDRYNICGDTELNNLEMAKLVAEIMGKPLNYKLVQSESARPGYDRRYALDGTKMRELGWTAPMTFRQSLEKIVNWTMANPHWIG